MQVSRKTITFGAGLIVLLTLLVYIPATRGGYIWDDETHITNNLNLRSLHGLQKVWFELGAVPQYYPMVHTSFWMEYHLWQMHPLGYHLVNILLHALNAVLLWLLLRYLSVPGAWLAAAIFALHPVHVESVAWVTERKNVLSGLFYLSSILAYLRFLNLHSPNSGRRWRFYPLALFLYLCALLSKTVACTMPAAVLLLLWWKRNRVRWLEVLALTPFFAVGTVLGLTTVWMEKHYVGAQGAAWALSFVDRCLIAGRALWFYAGKLLWPHKLTFIYPRWQINSAIWWHYLFPLLAVAVILILWLLRNRIGKGPLVAVLFFGGTLFPALGFFDVYPMQFSFVADHFQYLASIGLIVLAVAGLASFFRRLGPWQNIIEYAACLVGLSFLGVLTWQQANLYKDSETLWHDTIAKNPRAWIAHNNLGVVLREQGRIDEAIYHWNRVVEIKPDHEKALNNLGVVFDRQGKFQEAVDHYARAIQIKPDFAGAYNNLGVVLRKQGKLEEAIYHFSQALQINPDSAESHNNLGATLADKGMHHEAISHFSQALQISPDYAEAHNNLGIVLTEKGKSEEAIYHFSQALQNRPDYAQAHYNLGVALAGQGRLEEAIEHYYQAIRITPNYLMAHFQLAMALLKLDQTEKATEQYQEVLRLSPDSTAVLNNLAWILATHANQNFRDGARAVQLAERACILTGHKNPDFLDTLAAAYAEAARFNDAVQTAQKAVELALAMGRIELSRNIEKRMQFYQAEKAYYED